VIVRFRTCFATVTLVVLLLAGVICPGSFAQNIFSHTYNNLPGLSTAIYYQVEQDSQGAMWFVTQTGIVRYDGVNWQKVPDSLHLPREINTKLLALAKGGMAVIGTNDMAENLLAVYRNGVWEKKYLPASALHAYRFLVWEFAGMVHAAYLNADSLYQYSEQTGTWTGKPSAGAGYNLLPVRNIRANQGNLYILTPHGVYVSNNKGVSVFELGEALNTTGYDLTWSPSGDSLFIIGKDYLALKTPHNVEILQYNNELNQVEGGLYSTVAYKFPFVYYTSSSHLFLYDLRQGKSLKIKGHEHGSLAKWHDLTLDRQGILWMVNTRGISKLPSLAFTTYKQGYFADNEISVVLPLTNGRVFLGHNTGFSIVNDNVEVQWAYQFKKSPGILRVLDAVQANNGTIYATSPALGLIKINPDNHRVAFHPGIPYATSVLARKDTLWVGSRDTLYTLVNNKIINKEKTGFTRRLAFNARGELLLLQKGGIRNYTKPTRFLKQSLSAKSNIYFGGLYKGRFLVASLGGLYYYSDGQYEEFIVDGAHFNQPVYTFRADKDQNLWIGTSNGVYKVGNNKMLNHYDATNGLVSNEINRSALVFDHNNRLWIGCHEGLTLYNPYLDNPVNLPPRVQVDETRVNGRVVKQADAVYIDYDNRNIEFVFSAFSFYSEASINFQYKLEGLDDDWQHIGNYGQRSVSYHNLRPGAYRFHVRARESQNAWGRIASTGTITMKTPFYFSYWFLLLCLITFIALVAMTTNYLNQKKLTARLDQKLQEKMKEVLASKEELSQQNEELNALNVQLDSFAYSVSHDLRGPIASSLGLINLLKLDKQNNEKYFGLIEQSMIRMEKVINDVLEVSRNSRTEVTSETFDFSELTNTIIEAQKHREEARDITFKVKAGEKMICTDRRRLSIILTNLISNAIAYSDNRKPSKVVEVIYEKRDGLQEITVADNGIGIAPEYIHSLYKMFYRATERSNGSGLGLYIAEQTVKRINGHITVASAVGKWTTFKVVVPADRNNKA